MLPRVLISLVRLRSPLSGWRFAGYKARHILHIGAHLCEEMDEYLDSGCEFVSWVEANSLNKSAIPSAIDPESILWSAVTDEDGSIVTLKISENSVSSSILNLLGNVDFSGVNIVKEITVPTTTLNSAIDWANKRTGQNVDFLVLDIQGAEGLALSATSMCLRDVSAISIEVSRVDLYSTSYDYSFVRARLGQFGFIRTLTFINPLNGHGDELWINRKNPLSRRITLRLFSLIRDFLFFVFWIKSNFFSRRRAY